MVSILTFFYLLYQYETDKKPMPHNILGIKNTASAFTERITGFLGM